MTPAEAQDIILRATRLDVDGLDDDEREAIRMRACGESYASIGMTFSWPPRKVEGRLRGAAKIVIEAECRASEERLGTFRNRYQPEPRRILYDDASGEEKEIEPGSLHLSRGERTSLRGPLVTADDTTRGLRRAFRVVL